MSDQDNRNSAVNIFDCFHHFPLGAVVECAGGFIEHQQFRLLVKRSGNPNTLSLSTAEPHTPFANQGAIAFLAAFNHLGDPCLLRCFPHSLVIDSALRYAKGNIGRKAGIAEVDLLGHMRHTPLPGLYAAGTAMQITSFHLD